MWMWERACDTQQTMDERKELIRKAANEIGCLHAHLLSIGEFYIPTMD